MKVTKEERLQAYKNDLNKELSAYAEYKEDSHKQIRQLHELICSGDHVDQAYAENELADLTEEMTEMAYQHEHTVLNYRHAIYRLEHDEREES